MTFQNEGYQSEPMAYYYSYNQAGRVLDQEYQLSYVGYQSQGNGKPFAIDALTRGIIRGG